MARHISISRKSTSKPGMGSGTIRSRISALTAGESPGPCIISLVRHREHIEFLRVHLFSRRGDACVAPAQSTLLFGMSTPSHDLPHFSGLILMDKKYASCLITLLLSLSLLTVTSRARAVEVFAGHPRLFFRD